jgi:hypothetical protein
MNSSDMKADLKAVAEAMELLPMEEKKAYLEAVENAPLVVGNESNPSKFLRVENCAEAAARRLAKHWSIRKTLFGERAFRPLLDLTDEGALDKEDRDLLKSGSYMPLAYDSSGRSIVVADMEQSEVNLSKVRMSRPRLAFWAMTVAAENPVSQTDGFRIVRVLRSNNFDRVVFHRQLDICNTAMAVKLHDFHIIGIPPPGARQHFVRTVLPLTKSLLFGEAKVLMGDNRKQLQSMLLEAGFRMDKLPATLGGTWSYDEFGAWCAAHEQCTLHHKRSSPKNDKKRKQRRLAHVVAVPAEARVVHAVTQKNRRTVDHTYRDYSQVPLPADYAGEPVEISRMSFVERVHHMLSQGSLKGYIWWLPHGRAFKLCDFDLLEESKILDKYFGIKRASIFVLMLRSYGFKQLTSRKDRGSFFHEVSVFGGNDYVPDHLCSVHLCVQ